MIVLDIETSGGFEPNRFGIWQIGAIEFENPSNVFFQECRIDDEDEIQEEALLVVGKTKEYLRDPAKQSQERLLQNFFDWTMKINNRVLVAYNTHFDYGYVAAKASKYRMKFPFDRKAYDLHNFAASKYFEIHGELPLKGSGSSMSLAVIAPFCGLHYAGRMVHPERAVIIVKGDAHDGLTDAKLEAECLSRILYGKTLFDEFTTFKIPDYLLKP